MSESQPPRRRNGKWEQLRMNADALRLDVEQFVSKVDRTTKYRIVVSPKEHERASQLADAFGGEVLDFLSDNTTAKLAPIRPTRDQLTLLNFLFENVENGTLLLRDTTPTVDLRNRPGIVKSYDSPEPPKGTDIMSDLYALFHRRFVSFAVRYGVREPYPHMARIWGDWDSTYPADLEFLSFPYKPTSVEEAQKVLQYPPKVHGWTQKVDVFNNGERIVINSEGEYKGRDVQATHQYYFIGAFDGEGTHRTHWLYGTNSAHNKHTESVRVGEGVFSPAYQRSQNK